MTDHDTLAALPLTPDLDRLWDHFLNVAQYRKNDEAAIRAARSDIEAAIAAGVRVTGDAAWPYLPDQPHSVVAVCDGCGANVTLDDEGDWVHVDAAPAPDAADPRPIVGVDPSDGYHECEGDPCRTPLRAAVAGDASEAHPVGDAADTAAPDLRSSAGWLVERWDGNRTVQPDALRADIAVLRDALRNPQALSTLESRPCTTCGGYHFDRGANGRIDATCPVRAALADDTPEARTIPVMTAEELRRRWPASVERLLRDAAGVRVTGDAGLREALDRIRDITKPLSMTMQGPRWMSGDGDIFGGGNREKVWRIADAALTGDTPEADR